MSADFSAALNDKTTINLAREIAGTKRPAEEVIKEWQEQLDAVTRTRKKEKAQEILEERWDRFFTHQHKPQKDPDTSSVISYGSNITESSTTQKPQVTSYGSNIPELPAIQRPPVTRYGADTPKEVVDNIPAFNGKQERLSQFLNTTESYSTMYRVHKADLVLLHSRGKAHEIISHVIDEDLEWSNIFVLGSTKKLVHFVHWFLFTTTLVATSTRLWQAEEVALQLVLFIMNQLSCSLQAVPRACTA